MLNVKLMILMLIALFLSANLAQAKPKSMDKSLENKLVNICEALKTDNKLKLKRAIRKSGFKEHNIKRGLVCNGMDPITFALSENANVNAEYLAGRNGKKYIELAQKQLLNKNNQTQIND